MILRALYDYYQRDSQSIPFGQKEALISFVIVISQEGEFLGIEDYHNRGKLVFVPVGEHNNGESPLLFYDNVQYLLDYVETDNVVAMEKSHRKHLSFVRRCNDVAEKTGDVDLKAVCAFYESEGLDRIYEDEIWNTIKRFPLSWITFQIVGHTELIASKSILCNYIQQEINNKHICLVTGRKLPTVRLCASTPILGTKNSAKLVSFNDASFCSYGKTQGENATISEDAEFAFSSAFKKLLRNNETNHNKFIIGNRTYLFWASSSKDASVQAEQSLFDMLGFVDDREDDPNARIENVRRVFLSIYSGILHTGMDDRFYILGLAPNSARIAVVYWSDTPLKEFAGKILKHFEDMEIIDGRKEKRPYMGMRDMLGTVTLGGKQSDASPNLPDALAKSIFEGYPYPETLFSSCIRRIRAEQDVAPYGNPCRAAILKAYLNRLNDNNKRIEIMLDKENTNEGYLCGRLFAVLDKIQDDANHIHSIQERYMNSASATPAAVFSTILNISSHHSEKLNEGGRIYYEKLKQEIISKLPANGFPAHLDLQDQGRFFVGFYHQRQDFFTRREELVTE